MAVVLSHAGSAPFALSHASAAAVHGLPAPATGRAWLTVGAGHGARTHYDAVLRQEVATFPPDHMQQVRGWPVTTAGRTVADCLRHLPASAGVAVADAARTAAWSAPRMCTAYCAGSRRGHWRQPRGPP
jgi:predicted transcriptional regulator of viral defense system